jgi:hypothetical protein
MFLYDEWSAYVAGTKAALTHMKTPRTDTVLFMCEMAYYCHVVAEMSGDAKIKEFWIYYAKETVTLADKAKQTIHWNPKAQGWRDWIASKIPKDDK